MKARICPSCKNYLNEDETEYWCDYCDYAELKQKQYNWKLEE